MRIVAKIRRWLRHLFDINAHSSASDFLWRSFYIAASLAAFGSAIWGYNAFGTSVLWIPPAAIAIIVATANGLWPFEHMLDFGDLGGDGPFVLVVLALALTVPILLFFCSPFVLMWTLTRAYRASVRDTGSATR